MSLIHFHRFLIASAIVFCLGFAAWVYLAYTRTGGFWSLVLAAVFVLAGIALGYYLVRLRDFVKLPSPDRGSEPDSPHHEPW
jgi:uncharacterized membrane protein